MRHLRWRVLALGGWLFLSSACSDGVAGDLGVPGRPPCSDPTVGSRYAICNQATPVPDEQSRSTLVETLPTLVSGRRYQIRQSLSLGVR
jgi:hypothetical protein